MNKHIIIAGVSRSGKTTLALKLSKLGYSHYKMDSVIRGMCFSLNINQHNWLNISPMLANILNTIIIENTSDTVFSEEQYVLDVTHLFPKDVSLIDLSNTQIVFLGYDTISAIEKFEQVRKYDKNYYWSSKLSDQQLLEMIEVNIKFSKYLKEECNKYNIPYFDTSFNREKKIEQVKMYLLDNKKS